MHLLPPFRWRLAEVPFGLDHPYWVDDAELRPGLPHPRARAAGSGRRARCSPSRSRGIDRAAAGPRAAAVGALPDPRPRATAARCAHQDASRGRRRRVGRRGPGRAARPLARRAATIPAARDIEREAQMPGQLAMLARGVAGVAASPAARPALAAQGAPAPRPAPAHAQPARRRRRSPRLAGAPRGRSRAPATAACSRVAVRKAPMHLAEPADLPAPPRRVVPAVAGRGQADQGPLRRHRQRRRDGDLRGRPALVAGRPRRAARRAAGGDGARLGAHARAARDLRQPRRA